MVATSDFTIAELKAHLKAIKQAIFKGVKVARYDNKEIEYRSLKDMKLARDEIEIEIEELTSGKKVNRCKRTVAQTSKGL